MTTVPAAGQLVLEDQGAGAVFVPGTPAPQGSLKAFARRGGGHPIVTSDNPRMMPWRADVAAIVRAAIGPAILYPTGPVSIGLSFVLPRRAAEPKRITPAHTRKPDLDRLTRAVADALTGLVYADDAQVGAFHRLEKRTAAIAEQPGVWLDWIAGT
jgi:crossover junction endodeoxyribonuclease RusA